MLLGENLHTLSGGICALIELSRQVFDREGSFVLCEIQGKTGEVDLGLRKNEAGGGLELLLAQAFDVVALNDSERLQSVQLQAGLEVVEEGTGRRAV